MRRKMLYVLIIVVLGVAAALAYPVVKIKMSASVIHPEPRFIPASSEQALYGHVHALSVVIGSRSLREVGKIRQAEQYIRTFLDKQEIPFELQGYDYEGNRYNNIVVTLEGGTRREETIIIGAHYDTVFGTPGADDNASAVAVLLELCRALKDYRPERTLRLIFFVLEEPPAFMTPAMGSYVYAMQARDRGENIVGMIGLEMVGYFNEAAGSQAFPVPGLHWLFPDRGNFIGVVGNVPSRELTLAVAESHESRLRASRRASRGAALHPRHRPVRSRILLEDGLSGRHGDRHGLLPQSQLSRGKRHDRDAAVRQDVTARARNGSRRGVPDEG